MTQFYEWIVRQITSRNPSVKVDSTEARGIRNYLLWCESKEYEREYFEDNKPKYIIMKRVELFFSEWVRRYLKGKHKNTISRHVSAMQKFHNNVEYDYLRDESSGKLCIRND